MKHPRFATQLELQLWEAMQQAGISRHRLSKLAGVDECLLSNWVHGRRTLSARVIDKIAQVLGLRLMAVQPGSEKHGKSVQ